MLSQKAVAKGGRQGWNIREGERMQQKRVITVTASRGEEEKENTEKT